uniref:Uncharacterized protein n=1 Tax=Oryza barthii TaxID=65489 RepID=A0A0D3GM83_9ORYZ
MPRALEAAPAGPPVAADTRRLGWWWKRGDGHEDDSDDEEGGAYDGNGTGEQALVVLVVSSVAASASNSTAVSGLVPVGLAAKNLKLMHEGAQDLNLAFPQHHGHALQSLEFTAFPSLESSSMCNLEGNLATVNGASGRGSVGACSRRWSC